MSQRKWLEVRNLVLCCALLLAVCCTMIKPGAAKAQDAHADFAGYVISAYDAWDSAITFNGLEGNPKFDALASMAPAHIDDCIKFLADPKHTDLQKLFAIYAMHKTPLHDYLDFVRKLMVLVDRGHLKTHDLLIGIFPKPSIIRKDLLFDNYDNPDVQALLKEMAAWPGWSQSDREYLDWIGRGGDFGYRYRKYRDAILGYFGIK